MLTKVMFDSNSVGAVSVRSFYVCIACETFPMHVLLQVYHTMHLFVMGMASLQCCLIHEMYHVNVLH